MKLLLVDDQRLVRDTLRLACESALGHEVIGECGTAAEVVTAVRERAPDVVVLDLALPDGNGLVVVDRLHRAGLFPRIVILSVHCDEYTQFLIERAQVQAYVDKNASTTAALGEALNAVAAGRSWYSETYLAVREARRVNPVAFTKVLSPWELEILVLLGLGLSDHEVSGRLGIAPRTAKTHRSNILRKLNIPNTPKLIRFAVDRGFTALGPSPMRASA